MTKKQISENECLRLLVCLISFVVFVCFVADETIEIKLQLIMLRHRSYPSLNVAVVLISPSTKSFLELLVGIRLEGGWLAFGNSDS